MKSKDTNIFFKSNLKFLRNRSKLSQTELAEALGITRAKLNAWENGGIRTPLPEDYINASDFFKISIDTLMKIDLSTIGELKVRELQAGKDVYIKGGNLRVLAISVDSRNNENVEFVPLKSKAGYLQGYQDQEFIASLPKFSIPDLPKGKTFRVFPISGNSMLPIVDGSYIIGRYEQDWNSIKPDTACIVISAEHGMVFKHITIKPNGKVQLRSTNPVYEPYEINVEEINELWPAYGYFSYTMPEESNLEFISQTLVEIRQHLIK